MDPVEYTQILTQHNQLLTQLNTIWVAFLLLVFVQIVGLIVMGATAAWSVGRVTRSAIERTDAVQAQTMELQKQWFETQRKNSETLQMIAKTVRGSSRP